MPVDNNLKIFINRVRREPRPSPTFLWRAVVPIPVLDHKVPIIGLDGLSLERRLEQHTTRDTCLKVVSRNNHEKSAIFRVMISDISGLALYQWKPMFLEIRATFVYAMDLKLNLKLKKVRAWGLK